MDKKFINIKLIKLQEFESTSYFSPCRKECRKIIRDYSENINLKLAINFLGIATGSAYFLYSFGKNIKKLYDVLTGPNGLISEYCSTKCIIKNYEKTIRRENKRGIADSDSKIKLDEYKEKLLGIKKKIDFSIEKIEKDDKIKASKIKRLVDHIDDSVELFSI